MFTVGHKAEGAVERVRRLIEEADALQRANTTDEARAARLVLMPVEAWDALVAWARGDG